MLWHNLKLAFRWIRKDKQNSLINILGLAVGMAAVILISIYVQHELSYDKFNKKHERIYRLLSYFDDTSMRATPEFCLRLSDENFSSKSPGIEELTQIREGFRQDVKIKNQIYTGIHCMYVDTNFHKVFTLETISGKSLQAFSNPSDIIINASTAKKIFGTNKATGKELILFGETHRVSAVVNDLPKTSHFDFDMLLSFTGFPREASYQSFEYATYILLKKEVNTAETLLKIKDRYASILHKKCSPYGIKARTDLQKMSDIHLRSDYKPSFKPAGNINTIYVHILLACLILLVAIINFINILIVQYDSKLSQIGIQKAIGAGRFHLIKAFLGRSLLMTLIALILGMILAEILMPLFSSLMNRELKIDYLSNPLLYLGLPLLAIFVGFISGIYPAITITAYAPARIIKGKMQNKNNSLSQILVIFQFTVSIVLITAVIVSQKQINFMKEADLGFNTEKVIAINNTSQKQRQAYTSLKEELLKIPEVVNVSASHHLPGRKGSGQIFHLDGKSEKETEAINEYRVMPNFLNTLGIQLLKGRPFKEGPFENCKGVLLNETAARNLEIDNVLGRMIWLHGRKYEIQGIVKDFHYSSLRESISPLMITRTKYLQFVLIKIKGNNLKDIILKIKDTFKQFDPEQTNFSMFIDDLCRNQYQQEEQSQMLTTYSSGLSILLALLGLYALTLSMVQKRTKEIGIRKVNGANIIQISSLFLKTFSKWILIAFLVAIPIAWYSMTIWLENFTYRIDMGMAPFLIAGIATLLVACLTVGLQTWKAANRDPIESLRYE